MSSDEAAVRAHLEAQEKILDETSPGWREDKGAIIEHARSLGYTPEEIAGIDARGVRALREAAHGRASHEVRVAHERRAEQDLTQARDAFDKHRDERSAGRLLGKLFARGSRR